MNWRLISKAFVHCLLCGAYPTARLSEICDPCAREIESWFRSSRSTVDLQEGKAICGFFWEPGGLQRKVTLTYGLKGRAQMQTWHLLAEIFVRQNFHLIENRRHLLLAIPGMAGIGDDHSWRFARALAPWVGGHVLKVFIRTHSKSQKDLSRFDREKSALSIDPKTRRFLKDWAERGWKIILVDDVVTTGATARAAWHALYGVPGSEIWSLAYRLPPDNLAKTNQNRV